MSVVTRGFPPPTESWSSAGRAVAVVLMVVAASGGCVPHLAEIRQAAPDRVGRAGGDYQVLAGCITEGLQGSPAGSAGAPGRLVYQTVVRPEEKRMLVTGTMLLSHAVPTPLIDLTFRQVDASHVVIESRWGGLVTARSEAKRVDRQVWLIAKRCAGGDVEVAPPLSP